MRSLANLREFIHNYIISRVPGYISLFNILCRSRYRSDCITLLLTSPSKVYSIILTHYKGDIVSTDYTFLLVFVNPIVEFLKKPDIANDLLHLARVGRDKEFIELIQSSLQE